MDTSNPIKSNDRRTIAEILAQSATKRKQDLGYIRELARTADRVPLEVPRTMNLSEEDVRGVLAQYQENIPEINPSVGGMTAKSLVEQLPHMPICGLKDSAGIALHPPHKNNSEGKVCVRRTMGGAARAPYGLASMAKVVGDMVAKTKKIYTNGTWAGFMKRLDAQMGRPTVSLIQSARASGYVGSDKAIEAALFRRLDELLPLKEGAQCTFPPLEDSINDHLALIKITGKSSAGPPYWRNKCDCMEEIIGVGIPTIVEAMKKGELAQLQRTNPEMFLVEVKNKLDRYDRDKLDDKTRPYVCIPAHWSFLFSCLAQNFQELLGTFDKDGGANAYGFSGPHGGLTRHARWMYSTKVRQYKFACYGDDTDLVYNDGEQIWRIDPDFSQMDGSIHADDVKMILKYISIKLRQKDNIQQLPGVWKAVLDTWLLLATDPLMIVSGQNIYKKRAPTGLLSGVPGTTLFGTIKAMLSWDLCLENARQAGRSPLDTEYVVTEMKNKFGLIVKPGTYVPTPLPEFLAGNLLTKNKFLGVQSLVEEYRGQLVVVPHLPLTDALEAIVVQKDEPSERRVSETAAARTLFDRARGLFLTFGFSNDNSLSIIHQIVNDLPPTAILMSSNIEGGEKPDSIITGDYSFPDSSGFPSRDFCLGLYAGVDDPEGWIQLYPTLVDTLKTMRAENRYVRKYLRKTEDGYFRVHLEEQAPPQVERPRNLDVPDTLPGVKNHLTSEPPYARSHINEGKTLMNLNELIFAHMKDMEIGTVKELQERVQCSVKHIIKAASEMGFFIEGYDQAARVSIKPLQTHAATVQPEVVRAAEERVNLIDSHTRQRTEQVNLARPEVPPVVLAEETISVDSGFVDLVRANLDTTPIPPLTADNVISEMSMAVTRALKRSPFWKAAGVDQRVVDNKPTQTVRLNMLLKPLIVGGEEELVATASGCNSKQAKIALSTHIMNKITAGGVRVDKFTKRTRPPPPEPVTRRSGMPDWSMMMEQEDYIETQPQWDARWGPPKASSLAEAYCSQLATLYAQPGTPRYAQVVEELTRVSQLGLMLADLLAYAQVTFSGK